MITNPTALSIDTIAELEMIAKERSKTYVTQEHIKKAVNLINEQFNNIKILPKEVFSGKNTIDTKVLMEFMLKFGALSWIESCLKNKEIGEKLDFYGILINLLHAEEPLCRATADVTKTYFAYMHRLAEVRNLPGYTHFSSINSGVFYQQPISKDLEFKEPESFAFLVRASMVFYMLNNKDEKCSFLIPSIKKSLSHKNLEIRTVAKTVVTLYESFLAGRLYLEAECALHQTLQEVNIYFSKGSKTEELMPHITPLLSVLVPRWVAFFKEFFEHKDSHPNKGAFFEQERLWQKEIEPGYRNCQARTAIHITSFIKSVLGDIFEPQQSYYEKTFFQDFTFYSEQNAVEEKKKPNKKVKKQTKVQIEKPLKKEEELSVSTDSKEIVPEESLFLKTLKLARPPFRYQERVDRWLTKKDLIPFEGYEVQDFEDQIFNHGFTRLVDKLLDLELRDKYAFKTERGYGLVAQIYQDKKWRRGVIYYGIDEKTNTCYHRMFEERTKEQFSKADLKELFDNADSKCQELFDAESLIAKEDTTPFEADHFTYKETEGMLLFQDAKYKADIYIIQLKQE